MSKITNFKDMKVQYPNRYTVTETSGTKVDKTIDFNPGTIFEQGTPERAEYFNEIQKNSIYEVKGTRVVEGQNEIYDIAIDGSDTFVFDNLKLLLSVNETNVKQGSVLRFNGNLFSLKNSVEVITENYLNSNEKYFINLDFNKKTAEIVGVSYSENLNLLKGKMNVENTIEDLKNSKKYKVGDIVEVLGYYSKGDGSHHLRIAKDVDDGSGELGVDGLIWCILHDGEVNVSWFGAKGDGVTDDTFAIQKALLSDSYEVNGENREYIISSIQKIPTSLFDGYNDQRGLYVLREKKIKNIKLTLDRNSQLYTKHLFFLMSNDSKKRNIILENVHLVGNGDTAPQSTPTSSENGGLHGLSIWKKSGETENLRDINVLIKDCSFVNMGADGINTSDSNDYETFVVIVENTMFKNNRRGDIIGASGKYKIYNCDFFTTDTNALELFNYKKPACILFEPEFASKYSVDVKHSKHYHDTSVTEMGFYYGDYTRQKQEIVHLNFEDVTSDGGIVVSLVGLENKELFNVGDLFVDNCIFKYLGFTIKSSLPYKEPINVKSVKIKNSEIINFIRLGNTICDLFLIEDSAVGYFIKNGASSEDNIVKNTYYSNVICRHEATSNLSVCSFLFSGKAIMRNCMTTSSPSFGDGRFDVFVCGDGDKIIDGYHNSSSNLHTINITSDVKKIIINNFNVSKKIIDALIYSPSGNVVESILLTNCTREGGLIFSGNLSTANKKTANVSGISSSFASINLDTPYYTLKMQREGIYSDYVAYRDELHEYENSQTSDETMLLPVLQEPVIPESVKQFAEKYKLI